MASWLEEILESVQELESPLDYYYWSALASISAVMKRNVYLDRFSYKLYTNIFVFLIGHSGIRKGPPVKFAKDLVTKVGNTRVISGRASIQAIIRDLSQTRTQENGTILNDSAAFIASGEFAASLVEDPQALTILTDLYDSHYHDKWENSLKGGGEINKQESLKEPCITLLGASNQIHFKDSIDATALGGGFIARSFIILAEKKNRSNSLMRKPSRGLALDRWAEYLKLLSTIRGEFQVSEEGKDHYDEWYYKQDEAGNKKADDTTGTLSRIGDSVLKVAMLLSLARSIDLKIEKDDITDALVACGTFFSNINRTMLSSKSTNERGNQVALVLTELIRYHDEGGITRQKLLSKHWGSIDGPALDIVVDTLLQAGSITMRRVTSKEIYYKMTQETYDAYVDFTKER